MATALPVPTFLPSVKRPVATMLKAPTSSGRMSLELPVMSAVVLPS